MAVCLKKQALCPSFAEHSLIKAHTDVIALVGCMSRLQTTSCREKLPHGCCDSAIVARRGDFVDHEQAPCSLVLEHRVLARLAWLLLAAAVVPPTRALRWDTGAGRSTANWHQHETAFFAIARQLCMQRDFRKEGVVGYREAPDSSLRRQEGWAVGGA